MHSLTHALIISTKKTAGENGSRSRIPQSTQSKYWPKEERKRGRRRKRKKAKRRWREGNKAYRCQGRVRIRGTMPVCIPDPEFEPSFVSAED